MIKRWCKALLSYRLTFLVVPHGGTRPIHINIHLFIIILISLTWAGITFWGSYLSAQHVDYWRTQASNHVMKLKINYLMAQLDHSREYLDEVKTVDAQLRELIQHQNAASIIKNEQPLKPADATIPAAAPTQPDGTGGPTLADANNLTRMLQGQERDLSWPALVGEVGLLKNEATERLSSYNELTGWIEVQRKLYRATPKGWPCEGHLTSRYGTRQSPFNAESQEFHPGIDISGNFGSPIRATADGVIRYSGWNSGYGNLVLIQHDFGFSTRYAHNSRLLVRVGERVKRGQTIALMGTTGKSSGMHCHYEVWRAGVRKNPFHFLREDPKFSGKKDLAALH